MDGFSRKFEDKAMRLVNHCSEVIQNMHVFNMNPAAFPDLLSRPRSWYAAPNGDGTWLFGPSKFVGYAQNSLEAYSSKRMHGTATERALRDLFVKVSPESQLGKELAREHRAFLAEYDKQPNVSVRFAVLPEALGDEDLDTRHVELLASAVRRLSPAEREHFDQLV